MSKPIERVEIITGIHRRRRYTAEEKVRLVEQTMQPGMTVSAVARLYGGVQSDDESKAVEWAKSAVQMCSTHPACGGSTI